MTSPLNNPPEDELKKNAATDTPESEDVSATPAPTDHTPPVKHDLSPEDLHLIAEKPHHHHRSSSAFNPGAPPILIASSRHRHHSRSGKKKSIPRLILKILLIISVILLSICLVATATVLILREIGRRELLNMDNVVLSAPQNLQQNEQVVINDDGRTVTYNGEKYRFNENRTNILCIGIDKESMGLEGNIVGTGGQADALILLSIDTATGEIDAIAISRDTLTDIDLYTADGNFYGVENTQICLSYAYGNGRDTSCRNTVRAASRLFYGIPINTYFAVDLGAISILNDAVGGVQVTLLNDFRRTYGDLATRGETIILHGEEAQRYVRDRNVDLLDSNNARMERQKQYITAFFDTTLSATSKDLQVPLNLFSAVSANSITDLNASRITFLASTLVEYNSALEFHSIPGEVVQGEDGYAEYIVDETALYEQILSIFYTKV